MSSNSFTAPSIFHQTASTKLAALPLPKQPETKLLNNCFHINETNINLCSKPRTLAPIHTLPLIRPL
jgi:hypothetical protein